MERLEGKVAVITGAGSGQGRATAVRLAEEGARIAATDIDEGGLAGTAEAVQAAGGEALTHAGDISDASTIDAVVTQAVERWDRIDVLHNNAGRMLGGPLGSYTAADFQALMGVNCLAQLLAIQRVAPEMKKAGGGSIINVSSISALAGFPMMAIYCASKGAVTAMTRAIAMEVADDGIRCNAICPGAVDTPMVHVLLEAFEDKEAAWAKFTERQLQRRFAEPSEVASVVAFLASSDSSFMTGAIVPVEGGWLAW